MADLLTYSFRIMVSVVTTFRNSRLYILKFVPSLTLFIASTDVDRTVH